MFAAPVADKFEALLRDGRLGGGVFCSDDCQKDYDELKARGVKFRSPPEKKPFGIQATLFDNSNNWFSLTQPK